MTKKRNYENDEEFKNFNLEDYLPSMNSHKPEDIPSASGQETAIFPPLDEPDTSDIQVAVSKAIQPDEQEVLGTSDADEEVKEPSTGIVAASERTIVRRISCKQRRLSLDEYRTAYLQVPRLPTASLCSSAVRYVTSWTGLSAVSEAEV